MQSELFRLNGPKIDLQRKTKNTKHAKP
jgi:hypothetical protein